MAHEGAHAVGLFRIVEQRPALLVGERDVDMPAGARPLGRPLGHEGRHQAAPLQGDLDEGLEQGGLVGGVQSLGLFDGGFEDAGAGFLVQGFQAEVHPLAGLQNIAIDVGVGRIAQDRIAEMAGREIPSILLR